MIILSATADVLRLVTTSANALDVHASWVDNQANTTTPYTPGRTNTAIAAAATTTVLGSPAASTQRQLKKLTACARGGANTVTVQFYDGTTAFQAISVTLATGETLEYEDLAGWMVRDGAGALKTTAAGAGRLMRKPQVLTTGTTYNPPAGCTAVRVRLVGGGAGGGGTTSVAVSAAVGSGGASGGYAEKYYANPPASCTYAIGALGAGGAATGANGINGGDTTFTDGTTLVTAKGGLNGFGQAGGTSNVVVLGGSSGGQSSNGDVNGSCSNGGDAIRISGTVAASGAGGDSIFGGAGNGLTTQGAGNAAGGFGSGGGGGCTLNGGAAVAGGNGSPGVIIVEEYT